VVDLGGAVVYLKFSPLNTYKSQAGDWEQKHAQVEWDNPDLLPYLTQKGEGSMTHFNDAFWIVHAVKGESEAIVILDRDTLAEIGIESAYHDERGQARQDARQRLQEEFAPAGYTVKHVVEVIPVEGPHWQLPIGTALISQG
jgi:hypothetical protein